MLRRNRLSTAITLSFDCITDVVTGRFAPPESSVLYCGEEISDEGARRHLVECSYCVVIAVITGGPFKHLGDFVLIDCFSCDF